MVAVKLNNEQVYQDLQIATGRPAGEVFETSLEWPHDCLDRSHCWLIEVSARHWDDYLNLPGRR